MNIGIDIDDTITNTYETFLPLVALEYGLNLNKMIKNKETYQGLYKTLPNYGDFMRKTISSVAKIVPLKDDVREVLTKLREHGNKIIFITARNVNEFADPYKVTKDFLDVNEIPYDKVIVNVTDKANECILEDIDLFIDDNSDNCRSVSKKGILTWQFASSFNSKLKGIDRVDGWLDILTKIDRMYL